MDNVSQYIEERNTSLCVVPRRHKKRASLATNSELTVNVELGGDFKIVKNRSQDAQCNHPNEAKP